MIVDVITLFPEMIDAVTGTSILGRARDAGTVRIDSHQLRDFTGGSPHGVDDAPYGGGPGQLMRAEPIYDAVETIAARPDAPAPRKILLTPQGRPFDQAYARELAGEARLLMFCARYEGIDERARAAFDDEISIGDYVLTGGEIAALAVIDAVVRLLPGVLGSDDSSADESFSDGLLEYPQYTRPEDFRGMTVPPVLLSGNHAAIETWRREQSLARTEAERPDLMAKQPDKGKRKR